jgi:hypothetical protein
MSVGHGRDRFDLVIYFSSNLSFGGQHIADGWRFVVLDSFCYLTSESDAKWCMGDGNSIALNRVGDVYFSRDRSVRMRISRSGIMEVDNLNRGSRFCYKDGRLYTFTLYEGGVEYRIGATNTGRIYALYAGRDHRPLLEFVAEGQRIIEVRDVSAAQSVFFYYDRVELYAQGEELSGAETEHVVMLSGVSEAQQRVLERQFLCRFEFGVEEGRKDAVNVMTIYSGDSDRVIDEILWRSSDGAIVEDMAHNYKVASTMGVLKYVALAKRDSGASVEVSRGYKSICSSESCIRYYHSRVGPDFREKLRAVDWEEGAVGNRRFVNYRLNYDSSGRVRRVVRDGRDVVFHYDYDDEGLVAIRDEDEIVYRVVHMPDGKEKKVINLSFLKDYHFLIP